MPFIAPSEIQNAKLNPALRGYDREETEALLQQITVSYERVWSEREELRHEVVSLEEQTRDTDQLRDKLERLEPELDELRKVDQLLRGALVSTERTTEKLKNEARAEAEATLKRARKRADELNQKAESERRRLEQEIQRLERIAARTREECRQLLEGALEAIDGEEEPTARTEESPKLPAPLANLTEALPD